MGLVKNWLQVVLHRKTLQLECKSKYPCKRKNVLIYDGIESWITLFVKIIILKYFRGSNSDSTRLGHGFKALTNL